MIVGVPTEIKKEEYRVALTPAGARELSSAGHRVLVQQGAGAGSSFGDESFVEAGADIAGSAQEVFSEAELIVKVKEPQLSEIEMMSANQTLFTFLHLAAYPDMGKALVESGATAIAYETVALPSGALPLLAPMSEIAGRLGLDGVQREVTTAGGHTPQWAVTRAAAEIAQGERNATLIVGAEATRSMRAAGWATAPFLPTDRVSPCRTPWNFKSTLANLEANSPVAGFLWPT